MPADPHQIESPTKTARKVSVALLDGALSWVHAGGRPIPLFSPQMVYVRRAQLTNTLVHQHRQKTRGSKYFYQKAIELVVASLFSRVRGFVETEVLLDIEPSTMWASFKSIWSEGYRPVIVLTGSRRRFDEQNNRHKTSQYTSRIFVRFTTSILNANLDIPMRMARLRITAKTTTANHLQLPFVLFEICPDLVLSAQCSV